MPRLEGHTHQRGLSLGGETREIFFFFCTSVFSKFLSYNVVVGLMWKATQTEGLGFFLLLYYKEQTLHGEAGRMTQGEAKGQGPPGG